MKPKISQVIYAPLEEAPRGLRSVFLARTTSQVDTTDWREILSSMLANTAITIYNPYRTDGGSAPLRQRVDWELEKQKSADMVVVYVYPATQAIPG